MGWGEFFNDVGNFFGDITGTGESSARRQNEINREFQENMSNTAIQRRMADMEKAGINPILAAGDGASTPSGNAGAGGQGAGASINQMSNLISSSAKQLKTYIAHPYGSSAKYIEQNFGKKALKSVITNAAKTLIL